jgi:membrane-bound ClpP family serine protease
MNTLNEKERLSIQFWVGVAITVVGLVLLFVGLFCPPVGTIDWSVLTAFGEIATFAGALIGIDYTYKYKEFKNRKAG